MVATRVVQWSTGNGLYSIDADRNWVTDEGRAGPFPEDYFVDISSVSMFVSYADTCFVTGRRLDCVHSHGREMQTELPGEPRDMLLAPSFALVTVGEYGARTTSLAALCGDYDRDCGLRMPPEVISDRPAVDIAAEFGSGVVVLASGELVPWGPDGHLMLPSEGSLPPGVVEVDGTLRHTCARTSAGEIWCWGTSGLLDREHWARPEPRDAPLPLDWPSPRRIELPARAVDVAAGRGHSCALLENDEVYCWGVNDHAQLGDGTRTDSGTPVRVLGVPAP